MDQFLPNFHSGWAYLVLFFGLALLIYTLVQFIQKKEITASYKKVAFYTTLTFHIQFLVGIVLYFTSPWGMAAIQNQGMGQIMKDDMGRKLAVEHPLMMFAAVLFITIANAKIKRASHSKLPHLLFVMIAMACVFALIPWERWP